MTLYEDGTILKHSEQAQIRLIENIRSKLEYKTVQDIISSSDIIWSDDKDYYKDEDVMDLYTELYTSFDPFPERYLSLRLEFSSKNIEYADTSMIEVAQLIDNSINFQKKIICSDDNDPNDNLFIRIICTDEEEDVHSIMSILRSIEISCVQIKLKGCEGIEKVFANNNKISRYSKELGHHKENQWVLETSGSNLIESFDIKGIDHLRSISNNVIEIYEIFGIEAARVSLLNELREVLSFDGSYVNYRHLCILVDTMTSHGILMAITRHGINRTLNNAEPLVKASFEESVEVLTDAAAFCEVDTLRGISDNIMLGQLMPAGTGTFDVYYDDSMEPEYGKFPTRESTPGIVMEKYVPNEPEYPMLSEWIY